MNSTNGIISREENQILFSILSLLFKYNFVQDGAKLLNYKIFNDLMIYYFNIKIISSWKCI